MTQELVQGRTIESWIADFPPLVDLIALKPTRWFNPGIAPAAESMADAGLTVADVDDAEARLIRFAPYLAQVFPATRERDGIIESPLRRIPAMQDALRQRAGHALPGHLWLKMDSHLPVSGSIKARGGIHEVLTHAEKVAIDAGLITVDSDYRLLDTPEAKELFGQHTIAVGSTGNLGLSIGIMAAQLGFKAVVHMSADARQWKKDMLRSHGVEVVEYESDYSVAVEAGRTQAEGNPMVHFVDDENSKTLFLGYAVAGRRIAAQFRDEGIVVDVDHPLFVYLPCGVGGGPGGVAFGLKTVFGDHVHPIFAEPTHAPCMILGVGTGAHDQISVQDFGIDNLTAADGLAVGRASGFVGRAMQRMIDGYHTVDDERLFRLIALLHQTEGIDVEPSAAAGFPGPWEVLREKNYRDRMGFTADRLAQATHVVWATGGSMVPAPEMASYLVRGGVSMETEPPCA